MKPTVVFLHGLARTARSLSGLRKQVAAAGYPTWARTYPSRRMPIDELARTVALWIADEVGDGPVAAVTHSLGGIIVRKIGAEVPFERVVMLAPPNGGSAVATQMSANPLFRWFFGPAGQEVGDLAHLPAPAAPFGVIAGTVGPSIGNPPSWVVSRHLADGAHDGTVAVSETRLDGMSDFVEVAASHTWIMNHPDTRAHVLAFLESGRFARNGDAPSGAGSGG